MRFIIGSHPSVDAAMSRRQKALVGVTTFAVTSAVGQAVALAMHARGKH